MYHRACNLLKNKSFFLFGARSTGKTWLLEEEFRESALIWINLLESREFLRYHSRPELLRMELVERLSRADSSESVCWVVIDEVQRVPELLNEVHALIEDRQIGDKVKFALSGSSARKLKRGGANLLAGRALLNSLYPLTSEELAEDFSLSDTLSWGALPAVTKEPDPLIRVEMLETYVAVYLREEIREEQIVRNLDPFSRFLEVAAQTSGRIVKYSKIGRDCNVDSRAVARYFQILEETLLGTFLLPYHRSIRKQQGKSPKFYLFDIGVIRALEGTLGNKVSEGSYGYGRLFEHFLIWEIIKNNEYSKKRFKLSYLITKDGAEIDLIIERRDSPDLIIEIKSTTNPTVADARSLIAFKDDFPDCEAWVVSRADRNWEDSGARFLNWKSALRELFR